MDSDNEYQKDCLSDDIEQDHRREDEKTSIATVVESMRIMTPIGTVHKGDHVCYLLFSEKTTRTYIGYTPDIVRRIRKHNGEIPGGAKYTTGTGGTWHLAMLISGFKNKIQALQFEWMCKHIKRSACGRTLRMRNVLLTASKDRWTKSAPLAEKIPLTIHCFFPEYLSSKDTDPLPGYVEFIAYPHKEN